jgi:hypothetical protein
MMSKWTTLLPQLASGRIELVQSCRMSEAVESAQSCPRKRLRSHGCISNQGKEK